MTGRASWTDYKIIGININYIFFAMVAVTFFRRCSILCLKSVFQGKVCEKEVRVRNEN